MPVAITETPVPASPRRKRWTRPEYDELFREGPAPRLELIEGDLIDQMGKKRAHVNAMLLVAEWLEQIFGKRYVNTESPIDVAPGDNQINEPEPDIVVLTRPTTEFVSGNPPADCLRLVVEISDTTLGFDLATKARLYARAAIVEYWVLDVNARQLYVHREPMNGRYGSVNAYSIDESVAPLAAPESRFRVADAFVG